MAHFTITGVLRPAEAVCVLQEHRQVSPPSKHTAVRSEKQLRYSWPESAVSLVLVAP